MLILHDASYIVAELSYNIHAMVHFSNHAVFIFIFYFYFYYPIYCPMDISQIMIAMNLPPVF